MLTFHMYCLIFHVIFSHNPLIFICDCLYKIHFNSCVIRLYPFMFTCDFCSKGFIYFSGMILFHVNHLFSHDALIFYMTFFFTQFISFPDNSAIWFPSCDSFIFTCNFWFYLSHIVHTMSFVYLSTSMLFQCRTHNHDWKWFVHKRLNTQHVVYLYVQLMCVWYLSRKSIWGPALLDASMRFIRPWIRPQYGCHLTTWFLSAILQTGKDSDHTV